MNILLTGASGFVGKRIAQQISAMNEFQLTLASRSALEGFEARNIIVSDLGPSSNWAPALANQQVVVHAAARAHVVSDDSIRGVNVEGTLNLARQAASSGVLRFIFLSSIGVNGNINTKPFSEEDLPEPKEIYAQSKWEAEQGLWEIQRDTGMEIVLIRPPLVYGKGAPGNFGSLMRWVEKGIPLPFGAINNKRSLVAVDNLVDLIITCIGHPAAANQVFLVGDDQDLSTADLLRGVAKAAGKPSCLISVPPSLLMLCATLLGKKAMAKRLLGSLQVDISKARDLLGWEPPVSVEEGLRRCFIQK